MENRTLSSEFKSPPEASIDLLLSSVTQVDSQVGFKYFSNDSY